MDTDLEELHCEVNARSLAVRNLEIARPCCTGADNDRIVLSADFIDIDVLAYMRVGDERLRK